MQKFLMIIKLLNVKIDSKSRKRIHRMATETSYLGINLVLNLSSNCCVGTPA